jgi:hypothetical protein
MGYKWKLNGLSRKVDAEKAVQELERINAVFGMLTPELIVDAARDKNNPLHSLFDWNDTVAAEKWRMQQARTVLNNIEVTVISNGEIRNISVYEVTTKAQGYKNIVCFDKSDVEFVKNQILRDLSYLKTKLQVYKNFNKVVGHIESAITELTN